MRLSAITTAALIIVTSCKQSSEKQFEVSGTIKNSDAKVIYLEETPLATMQRVVLDSAVIAKDGSYSLATDPREETIFNLRLDASVYPFASVINDADKIKLNADLGSTKEIYTVEGSAASKLIKDFLSSSGEKVRDIYFLNRQIDSLKNESASDTIINELMTKSRNAAIEFKNYSLQIMQSSESPSLVFYILGIYQATANNPRFRLEALSNEEVGKIINDNAIKFSEHQGIASLKRNFEAEMQKNAGFVGKSAPEIILPDVNGKETSLSSFKGKYVLVDFWASWCKPCRFENPNIVQAFNKFKDKNFTILGVSLDQDKREWLKAIAQDDLAWTHISDLKYWNSIVVNLYNIDGIPYNVLVDPSGKIIAENLKGAALNAKLEQVLLN